MYIYYLIVPEDQESKPGSMGSSVQDLTRLESRCCLGYVFIGRLDWGRIHSHLIQVIGGIHSL